MAELISLSILFISAFGAATLIPFYSEITLVTLLSQSYSPVLLWFVATLGNTLGAAVNWWLGKYLTHFKDKRWFPFKESNLDKAQSWFQKYGVWSLLMAWLPIGGDALTLIAGVMKVKFPVFFLLTGIGKGLRYVFIIAAFYGLVERML